MAKQIEVIIGKDGSIQIDAIGYSGTECTKATAAFEQALGKVAKEVKKPEYRQEQGTQRVMQ